MKQPVQVKFCGITRTEDALLATALGASVIGLVFVEGSPRCISRARAIEICSALPPLTGVVGLFMDMPEAKVRAIVDQVPLNWLQFHGSESPDDCAAFGVPWIKALPMASPANVQYDDWSGASALLLDAHAAGSMGGSGETFDWESAIVPDCSWILAGGLNPDNVGSAVSIMSPPAVDVSSGIESAPGIKDAALMRRFMERIQNG